MTLSEKELLDRIAQTSKELEQSAAETTDGRRVPRSSKYVKEDERDEVPIGGVEYRKRVYAARKDKAVKAAKLRYLRARLLETAKRGALIRFTQDEQIALLESKLKATEVEQELSLDELRRQAEAKLPQFYHDEAAAHGTTAFDEAVASQYDESQTHEGEMFRRLLEIIESREEASPEEPEEGKT